MTATASLVLPWVRSTPSPPRPNSVTSCPVRPSGRRGNAGGVVRGGMLRALLITLLRRSQNAAGILCGGVTRHNGRAWFARRLALAIIPGILRTRRSLAMMLRSSILLGMLCLLAALAVPAPAVQSARGTGPWDDPKAPAVWPNQTSHANSDPWLAANHDKI